MWHEARKREKVTQKILNEHKKRAEKRREENRVDPTSLLQVHGLKSKICLDPNVYKQATKSLVNWQGDPSVTIDRFDVRATLSSLPSDHEHTSRPQESISVGTSSRKTGRVTTILDADESDELQKLLNYERYRPLIHNDLNKIPEDLRLNLVAKSESTSDAKMKKLMNNRFGTAGETMGVGFHVNNRPTTQPRRGVGIGHDYNAVPPPVSLCDSKNRNPDPQIQSKPSLDIAEVDEFDLEIVKINDFEMRKICEVASKYGLSGEEFKTLNQYENQPFDIDRILSDLKKLGRKSINNRDPAENSGHTKSGTYGPQLPLDQIASRSVHASSPSSNDSSPILQRSPRADIPTRSERISSSSSSKERSPTIGRSGKGNSPTKLSSRLEDSPESEDWSVQSPKPVGRKEKHESSSSKTTDNSSTQIDRATNSKYSVQHIDSRPSDRPRAATPLAYRKYARSSRSISRERNGSRSHRSYSSLCSSRRDHSRSRRRSSRDRKRSRRYSSSSTSSSRSSNRSNSHSRSSSGGRSRRYHRESRHDRNHREIKSRR